MLLRCRKSLSAASLALAPAAKYVFRVQTRSLRRVRSCSRSGPIKVPKGSSAGPRASSRKSRSVSIDRLSNMGSSDLRNSNPASPAPQDRTEGCETWWRCRGNLTDRPPAC